VSRNRKSLLREALSALGQSTRPVQAVVVVDNASTDGTPVMLAGEFGHVDVIHLKENAGSAGGYHVGIDWAARQGFDWIWTLDDDSIPHRSALAALLNGRERFPAGHRPDLLASKVVWIDGALHPMNVQKPKLYNPEEQFAAAEHGTMAIRFTSFVSMLIHRRLIETYGLPIPGYFFWNDDVEFSARILRREFGVMVPSSLVVHKTHEKHVPVKSMGAKYYYELRNKLWIIRHSDAFARDEKWWMAKSLIRRTWRHLRDIGFTRQSMLAIVRGAATGLILKPNMKAPVPVLASNESLDSATIAA